jgi:prepilin-type N-terminal cleavage/methylation domain-containing protein
MRRSGFTLLELMVVSAVLGIILMLVFGTMITSQKRAKALEDTVDIQQAARQIADIIERDLRHTGFMVSDAAAFCGVDNLNAPDEFYMTDWEVINPGDDLAPTLGATLAGATDAPSDGTYFTVDMLVIEASVPDPAYDTNGDMNPDSDFRVNGGFIIADRNNPERGTVCGAVTGVQLPNQIRVVKVAGGLDAVGAGGSTPEMIIVPALRYRVDVNGNLFRGPIQIASGVEDIQLALFFDLDDDNVIDPGEYFGDGVGPRYVAQGRDAAELREARLSVILRTRRQDPENLIFTAVATENRAVTAGTDGFRRRAYTTVVRMRNLGRRVQM